MDLTDINALHTEKPYRTYRKTILGKVLIKAFNVFTNTKEEHLLTGNPLGEDAMFDVFSKEEDSYFRQMNRPHLRLGTIIAHNREGVVEDFGVEQSSDDDIRKAVNSKFLVLQNLVKDSTSEVFLNRVLEIAREEEKSDKIITFLETRLSEVQLAKTKD